MQQAAEGTRLGARREREGMPGPGGSRGPESRAAPGEPGGAGTPPPPRPTATRGPAGRLAPGLLRGPDPAWSPEPL